MYYMGIGVYGIAFWARHFSEQRSIGLEFVQYGSDRVLNSGVGYCVQELG
jgi:hypothetical protein